jgi:hypothetical protein
MTPSQRALQEYIRSKIAEGAFTGTESPGDVLKKAVIDFAVDVPTALGDLLGDSIGKAVLAKAADIAHEIKRRGVRVVLGELRDALDMQYQRGVERQRRNRR